jgi:hypothetical protein
LQKKIGNISETRRDKLREDDEADEVAREQLEREMKENKDILRRQQCVDGVLDDFLDEDDEKFMEQYRQDFALSVQLHSLR